MLLLLADSCICIRANYMQIRFFEFPSAEKPPTAFPDAPHLDYCQELQFSRQLSRMLIVSVEIVSE